MRSAKKHLTFLILSLFIIGFSLFFYRHFELGVPLTPTEVVDSWTVEANLKFNAHGFPVKANFVIPGMPPGYAVLDEYFVTRDYGVTTSQRQFNRETTWSIRRAHGLQSLYYRGIFRRSNDSSWLEKPEHFPKVEFTEGQITAANAIITDVRKTSADIQTFAQETVKLFNHHPDGNTRILMDSDTDTLKNMSKDTTPSLLSAVVMVLQQANIHSLIVEGFHLAPQADAVLEDYLAVYNDKEWIFINPHSGAIGLPHNFLIWAWANNSAPLYSLKGGTHAQFNIAVSPTPISALNVAKIRGEQSDSSLIKFSLLQLPVHVQQNYQVLLTIPIGAFIILLLRNFVGLATFGTFMPVLIALAFRETHIVWGVSLFVVIVFFGLIVRFYLDHLRLLLVPRLAVILTVVILLMVLISIFCVQLGMENGLSVALFPMVILTMTIERMCISWDERGPADAIKFGLGSLFAAIIAYEVMKTTELEYLVFAFPELLFVLIASILLTGQYRGYRLLELFRFKTLSK